MELESGGGRLFGRRDAVEPAGVSAYAFAVPDAGQGALSLRRQYAAGWWCAWDGWVPCGADGFAGFGDVGPPQSMRPIE